MSTDEDVTTNQEQNANIIVNGPTPSAIREARDSMVRILDSTAGDAVKIAAINAIGGHLSRPVSISNCHLERGMDESKG